MRRFRLDIDCSSSVLIGGWTAAPSGIDAVAAIARDGSPLIPSTALRGALRESAERLLRGAGLAACFGGDGRAAATDQPVSGPCRLEGESSCAACRLFGGQDDSRPPILSLGDATAPDATVTSGFRYGVGVRRETRSAMEKHLFQWLMPMPYPALQLSAEGWVDGSDESLWRLLEATTRATTHIGRGRSRGMGRVSIRLLDPSMADASPVSEAEAATPETADLEVAPPLDDDIRILFELTGPACIGAPFGPPMVRDTLDHIPGSAIRGAIGTALARAGQAGSHAFDALFEGPNPAIFDFLYPVDEERPHQPPSPWPLTARRCKYHPKHPVVDTLLQRLVVEIAYRQGPAVPSLLPFGALLRCAEPQCASPTERAEGFRRLEQDLATRMTTRVALNRQTGSAREKMLFSHVMLEAGARFEGSIRRVPEVSKQLLRQALDLPLSVGRGTSRGWGALRRLGSVEAYSAPDLAQRRQRFDESLTKRILAFELRDSGVRRYLPISLLSPVLVADEAKDARSILESALGGMVSGWILHAHRFTQVGGWDQRPNGVGRLAPSPAVAAGSVYVAEIDADADWNQLLHLAGALELAGVGDRTIQGFGRVLFYDPFIYMGDPS